MNERKEREKAERKRGGGEREKVTKWYGKRRQLCSGIQVGTVPVC